MANCVLLDMPVAAYHSRAYFEQTPLNTIMTAYEHARILIDQAHEADPMRTTEGKAQELVYADRMEAWTRRLVLGPSPLLRLAARCQHLERWSLPRAAYPEGKVGYHAWRSELYRRQAARARELLLKAGVSEEEANEVATWVSKTHLKTNTGTQTLEDAAVLVFLEHEITTFAAQHPDYTTEKYIDILRKTWRKLSISGKRAAQGLGLPPEIAELLQAAIKKDAERRSA